jgi:hypothetical protein
MLDVKAQPRSFYLDDEVYKKLLWLAKTQALSASSFLRVLLRKEFDAQMEIERTKQVFDLENLKAIR